MTELNLFTMLSAFRPGSPATPFEIYCANGLAYLLQSGNAGVTRLFSSAAATPGEPITRVEVQPTVVGAGIADMVVSFENGRRAIVEIQVEAGADETLLPSLVAAASEWDGPAAFILLSIDSVRATEPWAPISWLQVFESLEGDDDPIARQFSEFILRDVLGQGPVPLEQATTTNRLYALGAAAIRRRFGERVRYVNSASRPMGGRYRYLGTTFSLDGGDMQYWVGIVNETIPLSEHYHLMLASKDHLLLPAATHPRATGDWKEWAHWTGSGRVVRPLTLESYEELLSRLHSA